MPSICLEKTIDKFGSWITTIGFLKEYKPKKGDTVIDCGAYFGYFTVSIAKKVGKMGKVIAFEPDKRNFKILQQNVASNKLTNVILINKALFNKNTKLNISSNFALSSIIDDKKTLHGNEVETTRLDNELKRLGILNVDFIKMDVEGAGLEVIDGAKETLNNALHLAIACYHKRFGKTTGKILQPVLEEMGFVTKIGFFLHPTLYAEKTLK